MADNDDYRYDLDELDGMEQWDGVSWHCDHDVPNGCTPCRRAKMEQELLDSMSDEERREYLYGPGGSFEEYFAPGGRAWQEEMQGEQW